MEIGELKGVRGCIYVVFVFWKWLGFEVIVVDIFLVFFIEYIEVGGSDEGSECVLLYVVFVIIDGEGKMIIFLNVYF